MYVCSMYQFTAIAAKTSKIDLYHFESELHDFQGFAKDFASERNLNLKISKGNDTSFIELLPKMTYHYETINKEEGPVLSQLCSLARQDGFKVMLTGDASDELFCGQPHHASFKNKLSYSDARFSNRLLKIFKSRFPSSPLSFPDCDPRGTDYNVFPPLEYMNEIPLNCLYHRGNRLADWQRCLNAYEFIDDKIWKPIHLLPGFECCIEYYVNDIGDWRVQM